MATAAATASTVPTLGFDKISLRLWPAHSLRVLFPASSDLSVTFVVISAPFSERAPEFVEEAGGGLKEDEGYPLFRILTVILLRFNKTRRHSRRP